MTADYELTWRCNLECVYCDRHTPMAREQIFRALAEFHELGMRKTHPDGGAPPTHRHVDEIVEWLASRDISVSMNTNGILVPGKLDTVRKLARVTIGLDGPRENHDAFRGRGSHDKAIAGAKAARSVGVPAEFTCTQLSRGSRSTSGRARRSAIDGRACDISGGFPRTWRRPARRDGSR